MKTRKKSQESIMQVSAANKCALLKALVISLDFIIYMLFIKY